MIERIRKAFRNRFRLRTYSLFVADCTIELPRPKFKKSHPLLISQVYKLEDVPDDIIIPKSIASNWKKMLLAKDHYIVIVTSEKKELAGYIMYTTTPIVCNEFHRNLIKDSREGLLSSGRTIPEFLGSGISEFCKRTALTRMKEMGIEKVYSFSRKENTAPQHVNRKIGMRHTHNIAVLRIYKRKIPFFLAQTAIR